jgi:hypothetical protein
LKAHVRYWHTNNKTTSSALTTTKKICLAIFHIFDARSATADRELRRVTAPISAFGRSRSRPSAVDDRDLRPPSITASGRHRSQTSVAAVIARGFGRRQSSLSSLQT